MILIVNIARLPYYNYTILANFLLINLLFIVVIKKHFPIFLGLNHVENGGLDRERGQECHW